MKLSEIIKSENTVIHCMTENAAKELCAELHRLGLKWTSGKSYKDYTNYTYYEKDTCYRPLIGTYDNFKYCENRSFNIIPFSKVEFDKDAQPETATACISDQPKPVQGKQIDWEQRRYEIAKDILANVIATTDIDKSFIKTAIEFADELIKQLK